MNWHELAENPQAIDRLYETPPALVGVELNVLTLSDDRLQLAFELPRFPDRPPHRWQRDGFNAAWVGLSLFGTKDIELNGWSRAEVDVTAERGDGGRVVLWVEGAACRLRASCDFMRIDNVTGYLRDDNNL